jgi:hypothetical protein
MELLIYYLISIIISFILIRWATIVYLKEPKNDISKNQLITVIIFMLVPFINVLWSGLSLIDTVNKSRKVSALKLFKKIFFIKK